MKKISAAILLAAMMVLSLFAGCGDVASTASSTETTQQFVEVSIAEPEDSVSEAEEASDAAPVDTTPSFRRGSGRQIRGGPAPGG